MRTGRPAFPLKATAWAGPWGLTLSAALWAALASGTGLGGEGVPAQREVETRIAEELIGELASPKYQTRQVALECLRALGQAVRPALERALEEKSAEEVKTAVAGLLRELGNATVAFEIHDRFGNPAQDIRFRVEVIRKHGIKRWELATDALGCARIEGLNKGETLWKVNWENAVELGGLNYGELAPGLNLKSVMVARAGEVQGQVLEAGTDRALEGIEVALLEDRGLDAAGLDLDHPDGLGGTEGLGRSTGWFRSGKDGRFSIQNVSEGSHFLFCRHESYVAEPLWTGFVGAGKVLVLEHPVHIRPRAPACGTAFLKVLGREGRPTASGAVQVQVQVLRTRDPEEERAWRGNRELRMSAAEEGNRKWGDYLGWRVATTDARGILKIEMLRPGRYRFNVMHQDAPPVAIADVAIRSGVATTAECPAPGVGGGISGRVSPDRKVYSRYIFLVKDDDQEYEDLINMPDPYGYRFAHLKEKTGRQLMAYVGKDDSFSFSRLAPGMYSLYEPIGNSTGWRHAIEVREGEVTRIPALFVPPDPRNPQATAQKPIARIEGTIFACDGAPCAGAKVMLGTADFKQGTELGANGRFSVSRGHRAEGWTGELLLQVSAPGHQPRELDLRSPGLDLEHLEVRLQPQRHGALKVRVTDPEGKPLTGCRVAFRPSYDVLDSGQETPVAATTACSGEAVLRGLATGERHLDLERDGYFVAETPRVRIEADGVKDLKIVMRPLLSIQGTLAGLPKEIIPQARVLCMSSLTQDHQDRTAKVDPEGRFKITQLKPGLCVLRALVPGWIEEDPTLLHLEDETRGVQLRLCRPGGLQLDLGEAGRGWMGRFWAAGAWDPFACPSRAGPARVTDGQLQQLLPQGYQTFRCDSRGRTAVFGLKPGPCDLLVKPFEYLGSHRHDLQAWRICRGVAVPVPAGAVGSFAELQTVKPTWPEGDCAIQGWLRWKDAAAGEYAGVNADLFLYVVGAGAFAELSFGLEGLVRARLTGAEDPLNRLNHFTVRGLPPGEYKIAWRFNLRGQDLFSKQRRTDQELPLVLLKTVHLAAGQTLDLGELVYEPDGQLRQLLIWDFERDHPRTPVGALVGRDLNPKFRP